MRAKIIMLKIFLKECSCFKVPENVFPVLKETILKNLLFRDCSWNQNSDFNSVTISTSHENLFSIVAVTRKRGVPVTLDANYFELAKLPRFELCQYRVDFEPKVDFTTARKELVNKNRDKIGSKFVFDGASMYLTTHFDEQCIETTHLGQQMLIKIRKTGMIDSHDPAAFQLLNLMFRDAMARLKLQTVRRDLFDPQAKVRCTKFISTEMFFNFFVVTST